MADQKLTDRSSLETSSASSLIHVVDNGTSYNQTKANFLKDVKGYAGDIDVSAIWTSGLSFDVTADSYIVNNTQYSSTSGTVTLDTADATLDRIDLIVAVAPVSPATTGTVGKISGTPASPTVVTPPDHDPSLVYVIKQVLIKAAASTPFETSNTQVFDEDVEWTTSFNSGNISVTATDPQTGTVSIEATNNIFSDTSSFTAPSAVNTQDVDLLTFWIKLKESTDNAIIAIRFWLGTSVVGTTKYFLVPEPTSTDYQFIKLNKSDFNLPSGTFNKIDIQLNNSTLGYFLDNVIIHQGSGIDPSNLISQWYNDVGYVTDKVFNEADTLSTAFYSEDFATDLGDFTTTGDVVWARVADEGNGDTYSARSGAITHDQLSVLTLTKTTTQENTALKFDYKTSTEDQFDWLMVTVDGIDIVRYSGTNAWTSKIIYIHGIGSHTINFTFFRDHSDGGGTNQCWIDNVGLYNATEPAIFKDAVNIKKELYVEENIIAEKGLNVYDDIVHRGEYHFFNADGTRCARIRNGSVPAFTLYNSPNGGVQAGAFYANATDNIFEIFDLANALKMHFGYDGTNATGGFFRAVGTDFQFRLGEAIGADTSTIFVANGDGIFRGNLVTEAMTSTGTRAGSDLVVTIGDYDFSGNGIMLEIDDANSHLNLITNGGQVTVDNDLRILDGAEISFGKNSFNSSMYPNTLTTSRVWNLPDASGTVALTSDLGDYVDLTSPQAITGTKTIDNLVIDNLVNITSNGYIKMEHDTGFSSGSNAISLNSNENLFIITDNDGTTTRTVKLDLGDLSGTVTQSFTDAQGVIPLIKSTVPTSATDTGVVGQIAYNSSYFYVCTATNTWVRTALATW